MLGQVGIQWKSGEGQGRLTGASLLVCASCSLTSSLRSDTQSCPLSLLFLSVTTHLKVLSKQKFLCRVIKPESHSSNCFRCQLTGLSHPIKDHKCIVGVCLVTTIYACAHTSHLLASICVSVISFLSCFSRENILVKYGM